MFTSLVKNVCSTEFFFALYKYVVCIIIMLMINRVEIIMDMG